MSLRLAAAAAAVGCSVAFEKANPVPTAPQLAWQKGEIMALIHFNMATFFKNGDPGCDASNWAGPTGSNNPDSFAPSSLNISNWVESMQILGINEAVLTAKHGCGFYLWQTNVTLPDGTRYPYRTNATLYGDVLRTFADTLSAAGIGHGFYYSLTNNFFLNVLSGNVQPGPLLPGQANVTQAQFEDLVVASLTELWSQFGNLTEIWFDGGYFSLGKRLQPILLKYQSHAVAFGASGLSPNPVRWCGTEGGNPPGWPDIWSTDCDGGNSNGCAPNTTGAIWNPSAVDFTLQQGDVWFYEPGNAVHTLADLVNVYHKSVGANGRLELDFAIDRTGRVDPVHAARYKDFGEWIQSCYGSPVAYGTPAHGATVYILNVSSPASPVVIDRVMLQEDQTTGQNILGYTVEVQNGAGPWTLFSSGRPIGNKRIDLGNATAVTALRFTVTATFGKPVMARIAVFAPEPCVVPAVRVRFQYSNGQCLISNSSTFPCPGGQSNSCPVFLGDCSDPTAVWDDSSGGLMNVHFNTSGVNIDCDYTMAGTVAKLLDDGAANTLMYTPANGGQLVYTAPAPVSTQKCLNGGQDYVNPPCDSGEHALRNQISIQPCSSAATQGWTRVQA